MIEGVYQYPPMERISYGVPLLQALPQEIERIGARSVYVLASATLARLSGVTEHVSQLLGKKLAGICTKIGAHTPRLDVVAAANAARAAGADAVLSLGGGSITDAAKMVGLCLANHVSEPGQLDGLRARVRADGTTERPAVEPPTARAVAVPTTLSAGEFTWFAGCTDTARHVKESYGHPLMMPRSVILDPAMTLPTPEWLFLSTGIRAVDHAVEVICSINTQPLADATATHALRLLSRGLRAVKTDPRDLQARLDSQLGAWMSIVGVQSGVNCGASHGIGHVLGGTAGVPHGYTSCVMLPHVLRFNAPVNGERQLWISAALGQPTASAAEVIAELVMDLGLPGRLRDVGVKQEQLELIAEQSMHDRWVHTNPRKIDGPATVRTLLDLAW